MINFGCMWLSIIIFQFSPIWTKDRFETADLLEAIEAINRWRYHFLGSGLQGKQRENSYIRNLWYSLTEFLKGVLWIEVGYYWASSLWMSVRKNRFARSHQAHITILVPDFQKNNVNIFKSGRWQESVIELNWISEGGG